MSAFVRVRTRRAAYFALALLTLIWSSNWPAMKIALTRADPVVYNVERTWFAIAVLFAVMAWQRRLALPPAWWPVAVTGFFQITVNFGSTVMALADGGIGRTSMLVFTMPFWTLLLAWPVLGERVRGSLWFAAGFALLGLVLLVEPWRWEGDLAPKLWAVLSGFGWAAATVATKYYQARYRLDLLNFLAWQMLLGVVPLTPLVWLLARPASNWDLVYAGAMFWTSAVSIAFGFLLWIAVLRRLPAGTASLNAFAIPVIALGSSMILWGERLTPSETAGVACLGVGLAILSWRAWSASRTSEASPLSPAG